MTSITRRQFNKRAIGSLLLPAFSRGALASSFRPNVLVVIADQWRYQATGYGGDPNVHMPWIDKFARESVNFENAIAGCSLCCPSRASIMTGQYPLTNGVYINDVPLVPTGITFGEAFASAGYRTGYIGKWHLYGSPDGKYGRREAYIPPEKRFGFQYWKAAECTHDYNHSFYYAGDDPTKRYWPGYDAQAQTEDACAFIRGQTTERTPYLLFLSWGPPHFPLDSAPEKDREMYRGRKLLLRPNVPAEKAENATEDLRGYYAHISALDDCFKQLLDTLKETGTAENTMVVFTSDHGDMLYSQGLMDKTYPWEESIRIPFLVRHPVKLGRDGKRCSVAMNSPDILPTVLGLAGLPIPRGVQGTDWSAVLEGVDNQDIPHSSFISLPGGDEDTRSYGFAEYRGVRTERYTYVRSIRGPWLLYDNWLDPYQMHNLCDTSEVKAIQAHLEGELHRWLEKLDDRFLPATEYLKRDGLSHYLEMHTPIGYTRSPWGDWESTLQRPPLAPLSIDSAIGDILDNPAARAALLKVRPDFITITKPHIEHLRHTLSLRIMAGLDDSVLTEVQLREIDKALSNLARTRPVDAHQH